MSGYADIKNEPELLKIKTRDDEIKSLKYQTEKHDHENILKSLKADNEKYKKIYKSLNKKKILLIVTEILVGSGSAISTSTIFNNVINKSKHWYSINFFNSSIIVSCYINHKRLYQYIKITLYITRRLDKFYYNSV